MRPQHSRRGSALIVALGVLALFSGLALGMIAVMRTERRATANYLDAKRAHLVAEAGLNRALAELSHTELREPCGSPFSLWHYGSFGVPLGRAPHPSYPRSVDELGACSGTLGGTYTSSGDRYVLKVIDTSAKLDLRADPSFLGPALDALGGAVWREDARAGVPGAHDPIAGRGARVAAWFATQSSNAHVRDLFGLLGEGDARRVLDYVTLHARRDALTVSFNGARDARGLPVPGFKPRAPVCVNTAPWAVLVAVLTHVTGRDNVPVGLEQAMAIADRLDSWRRSREVDRGPFRTWTEFLRFAESELPACGLTPGQREAILANASPFLAVDATNPDSSQLALGSRTFVRRGTTEFALLTSGEYEITSIGRIHGPSSGEVVAESTISVLAHIFETERHRTQADFLAGSGERTIAAPALGAAPVRGYGWVQLDPLTSDEDSRRDWTFADARTGAQSECGGTGPKGKAWGHSKRHHGAAPSPSPILDSTPLEPRGAFHHDGLRCTPGGRALLLPLGADAPSASGRLGLWVKLGPEATPAILVEATVQLSVTEGVRERLEMGLRGDSIAVMSERRLLSTPGSAVAPSAFVTGRSRAEALAPGRAHEWHWVEIVWERGTEQTLWVDGHRYTDDRIPSSLPGVRESTTFTNMIALGGTVGGIASAVDATVEGLVLDDGTSPRSNRDRYWAESREIGKFTNSFSLPGDARLGTISWTAFRPRRWGGVAFRRDEFAILASIEEGSTSLKLQGDGEPSHIAALPTSQGSPNTDADDG